MKEVEGMEVYDFNTTIDTNYDDSFKESISKDNFISKIHYNYSGMLPGMARIRFYAVTADEEEESSNDADKKKMMTNQEMRVQEVVQLQVMV